MKAGWKHHAQGIIYREPPVGWFTQLGLEIGPKKYARDCEFWGALEPHNQEG